MADLKKLADEATAQAALAIGKEAARKATRELLSDDADKAGDGPIKPSKAKLWKFGAIALVGLLLVVGLLGLVLTYWYWFLAAGVLGLAGLVGYWKLKGRAKGKAALPEAAAEPAARVRVKEEALPPPKVEAATPKGPSEAERRAELEARTRAAAEARALREQEVEDELAAMKARLKK